MNRKQLYNHAPRWGQPPPRPKHRRTLVRVGKDEFGNKEWVPMQAKHFAEDHFNDLPIHLRERLGATSFGELPPETRWDLIQTMKGLIEG